MTGIPEATPTYDQIASLIQYVLLLSTQLTQITIMLFACFVALLAVNIFGVARLFKR